ncbi:hypothetical protein PR048_007036 [Dryococelus australis]|uniref:Uncharacterized protein n=1 Tax=Dryococelus australis TaxID=614101 RepID=A0ABQ9IDU8_9NEOP|nr:hypothetical protein PR048_007036 [Dryococelus australis]
MWLAKGDFTEITNEELDDRQIISAVLQTDAEEDDIDDEDKGDIERISHSAAKEAFEILLIYIKQHPTTPMDIMRAKQWRNASAKSRISHLKQKNITDFF